MTFESFLSFFVGPDICVICPIISCYARTFVHTCKENYFDLCQWGGAVSEEVWVKLPGL